MMNEWKITRSLIDMPEDINLLSFVVDLSLFERNLPEMTSFRRVLQFLLLFFWTFSQSILIIDFPNRSKRLIISSWFVLFFHLESTTWQWLVCSCCFEWSEKNPLVVSWWCRLTSSWINDILICTESHCHWFDQHQFVMRWWTSSSIDLFSSRFVWTTYNHFPLPIDEASRSIEALLFDLFLHMWCSSSRFVLILSFFLCFIRRLISFIKTNERTNESFLFLF